MLSQLAPVLIADDEAYIRKMVEKILRAEGIDTIQASSGPEALKVLATQPVSLVILDIMLGGMDGYEVMRKLRADSVNTPILVLSGKSEDYDQVLALGIGADDYVTKPFSPSVLAAKVKASLRRHGSEGNPHLIECPPFRYVVDEMRLFKDGEEIFLAPKESRLMKQFMTNQNAIFTKEALYTAVWANDLIDEDTVMVHIRRLRAKIEKNPSQPRYIKTVHGVGYRFSTEDA